MTTVFIVKHEFEEDVNLEVYETQPRAYDCAMELIVEILQDFIANEQDEYTLDAKQALDRINNCIAAKEFDKALTEFNWEYRFGQTVTVVGYQVLE